MIRLSEQSNSITTKNHLNLLLNDCVDLISRGCACKAVRRIERGHCDKDFDRSYLNIVVDAGCSDPDLDYALSSIMTTIQELLSERGYVEVAEPRSSHRRIVVRYRGSDGSCIDLVKIVPLKWDPRRSTYRIQLEYHPRQEA